MPSIAIIGASRGIGRELVSQYAAAGWDVYATARTEADIAELTAAGVHTAHADVTDEASLAAVAATLPDLDVVIANAGVGSTERNLADIDIANWERVMRVNALGPLLVARTVGLKIKRPGGRFAALSSMMGSIAINSGKAWAYRMSKSALNMAMSNLAIEWTPDGVAVATLHPGWVKTAMGGPQAPVEVADSAAGLRRVIDTLAPGKVRYLDYTGAELGW